MTKLLTAAVALAAIALAGPSGPSQSETLTCNSHAKAGVVCSSSPAHRALNLPSPNGRVSRRPAARLRVN